MENVVTEFKELVTDGTAKLLQAKMQLAQSLATWENNFRGLADHIMDNGLAFENETEKALVAARNALLKEKTKVEAELQAFAKEQQEKAEAAAKAAAPVAPPVLDAAAPEVDEIAAAKAPAAPEQPASAPEPAPEPTEAAAPEPAPEEPTQEAKQ